MLNKSTYLNERDFKNPLVEVRGAYFTKREELKLYNPV
jgi:hypothetical protein